MNQPAVFMSSIGHSTSKLPTHPPKKVDRPRIVSANPTLLQPHEALESLCFCRRCKRRQVRQVMRLGPMFLEQCKGVTRRDARRSGKGIWVKPLFAWLFAPLSVRDPRAAESADVWREVIEFTYCPNRKCNNREEKRYFRDFPRFRVMFFWFEDFLRYCQNVWVKRISSKLDR